ncbi:MAG TPA: hypothetical protein VK559_06565 [Ferruginibacter sp.]|nr:hypothetical protein [Ferruginibacter sp.]
MKYPITKTSVVCTILSLGIMLSACKKPNKVVQSNVPLNIPAISFVIPFGQTSNDTTITIYYNVDSVIRAANPSFNSSNIKSVVAASVTLSSSNADNLDNFGNFSSFYIQMISGENPTPVTFAQVTDNPSAYALSLDVPTNDSLQLKNYFYTNSFTFTIRDTVSFPTFIDLNTTATIKFFAVAGPN